MKQKSKTKKNSNAKAGSQEPLEISPEKLIAALQRSVMVPETECEVCKSSKLDTCAPINWAPQPEATLFFRQPIALSEIGGDPIEGHRSPLFACNSFDKLGGLNVYIAIDVLYEQRWHFRDLFISSLSSTIALAPQETLRITLRHTQRKYLDRLNIEEIEQSQEIESTFVDKDILNVARSSAKTSNWSVSGNGSFDITSSLNLGISSNFSESFNETSSSSAESVQESTIRSAENLRTLQKTEVREITEVTQEDTNSREIINPYRDRSLRLNVFNLSKKYCVEFHAMALRPAIIIELVRMDFDKSFVIANGSFLDEALMDASLRFELSQALEEVIEFRPESIIEKARERALLALRYLFSEPNLFDLPIPPLNFNDPNLPESSFVGNQAKLFDFLSSGFRDALDLNYGTIFTVLGMYFDMYKKDVEPNNDGGEFGLELVLALESALAPVWPIGGDTQNVTNLLDDKDYTEVFRRLSGFLTIVSGMIKPLLQPAEEEREAAKAAKRAESVIDRVVAHLNCYTELYTQRLLEYVAEHSRMQAIFLFVRELLADDDYLKLSENAKQQLLLFINIEGAFIDRNKIIVPAHNNLDIGTDTDFADVVGIAPRNEVKLGVLRVHDAVVPADGFHLEAVAGDCVLEDVEFKQD